MCVIIIVIISSFEVDTLKYRDEEAGGAEKMQQASPSHVENPVRVIV